MIGIDTNVLVHHLVHDEPRQAVAAARFLGARDARDPAFISTVVLVETVWVLRRRYKVDRLTINATVRAMLACSDIVIESASTVRRAMRDAEDANSDLVDAIIAHAAIDAGADGAVTFDKRAQHLPGMLPVG